MNEVEVTADEGVEEETRNEIEQLAQGILGIEEGQAQKAANQAVFEYYRNRVISMGVQVEMIGRENAELRQKIVELEAEIAGFKKPKPPAKKAAAKKRS